MRRMTVEQIVLESDGRILCNHPWRYGDVTQDVYHRMLELVRAGKLVRIGVVSQSRVCELKKSGLLVSNTNGRGPSWPVKVIWVCGEA